MEEGDPYQDLNVYVVYVILRTRSSLFAVLLAGCSECATVSPVIVCDAERKVLSRCAASVS